MSTDDKTETKAVATPTGRLINESLFEKDKFNAEAIPSYKVELAIDNDADFETLEAALYDAAIAAWPDTADAEWDKDEILLPFKDGDKMARAREEKGKTGDAYKGMTVIRAHTIFNKDGNNAPGGIMVYDCDLSEVDFANRSVIFPGIYGEVGVTVGCYTDSQSGDHALMFYLTSFHKDRGEDSDRLVSAADHSKLFKPVGKKPGGRSTGRAKGRGRGRKEADDS